MQLDQNTINKLMTLDDETLWRFVITVASANGVRLPKEPPPKEDFDKLRAVISNVGQDTLDLNEAKRLIDKYRREQS